MRTGPLAPQSRKRYIGALTNDLQQLDGVWHGYLIVELQPPPSLQYSSTSGRTRLIPLHQIPHATQAIPINSLTQHTEQYHHSGEANRFYLKSFRGASILSAGPGRERPGIRKSMVFN